MNKITKTNTTHHILEKKYELIPYLSDLVCDRFRNDQKYRNGHIAILNLPKNKKILGLHIPQMKQVAKDLVSNDGYIELIDKMLNDSNLYYEEEVILGLMINKMQCSTEQRLEYVKRFVPRINNWAVCDTFCSDAKWVDKKSCNKAEVWNFLQQFFFSDEEFKVRFAIVFALAHYLNDEYLLKIFDVFEKMKLNDNAPYYIKMAVAWLLATALAKYPDATRQYLSSCTLPESTIKLYIRKAKESLRTKNVTPF